MRIQLYYSVVVVVVEVVALSTSGRNGKPAGSPCAEWEGLHYLVNRVLLLSRPRRLIPVSHHQSSGSVVDSRSKPLGKIPHMYMSTSASKSECHTYVPTSMHSVSEKLLWTPSRVCSSSEHGRRRY